MAEKYLRSTDGDDADAGGTWALANATIVGLTADMAAGDTGFVSQAHAESDAGTTTMTVTFPGTLASPNKVICANDSAEPPTATATTGSLTRTSTGSSANVILNGCFNLIGLIISVNASSSTAIKVLNNTGDVATLTSGKLALTNASSTIARISVGSAAGDARNSVTFNNCLFSFANTSQGFTVQKGTFAWVGGGIDAGSAAITTLFATALASAVTITTIRDFDASACASSVYICVAGFACNGSITLERVKMPASWTGGLFAGLPTTPSFRVSMYNCDSADTNYKILVGDRQGTLRDETTLVMTGGGSESWKVTTTANATETLTPFATDWMAKRNTAVGSAKTITVEILHDSTTDLTDGDIWLEVETLGTSGVPLGVFTSGQRGPLATAADHTNSSVTWTTTGMTNPNKQYLTVSVTPQEVGNIMARVMVAKASYTVYVNPEFSIT